MERDREVKRDRWIEMKRDPEREKGENGERER